MHIQDPSQAKKLEPHWGYADRVLPCTNDAGTCEYLDSIYSSHDLSMLYTFILWCIIGGFSLIYAIFRISRSFKKRPVKVVTEIEGQNNQNTSSLFFRLTRTTLTYLRHHLLPKFPGSTFGPASRLQVLILVILSIYLSIFLLVGIVYKSWIVPNKHDPMILSIRTGFGGFVDRTGSFAFAITPLTVFLSTRESILTLVTGISYQHFNFLHRWTGRLIFVFSSMHTFGWMVIMGCLYQPQPSTFITFIIQPYIIWGSAAMVFLIFLYVFSIKSIIERTGYEFFLISHLTAAIMYICTCWKHWEKLQCWMIASLSVILLDLALRTLNFTIINFKLVGKLKGFVTAQASITSFNDPNGKVVRLDFEHKHTPWQPGQHFFITFPALSIWQSHPFTPISSPRPSKGVQKHSYIIRCRTGETSKLNKLTTTNETTSVLLSGPYGSAHLLSRQSPNILAITGGTGISFCLPIILEAASCPGKGFLQLVWVIRRVQNLNWAGPEIRSLRDHPQVSIRIIVTSAMEELNNLEEGEEKGLIKGLDNKRLAGEEEDSNWSLSLPSHENFEISCLGCRPKMTDLFNEYLERVENDRVLVLGSGPLAMGKDVRKAAAAYNIPRKVWKGDLKGDIEFYWDY